MADSADSKAGDGEDKKPQTALSGPSAGPSQRTDDGAKKPQPEITVRTIDSERLGIKTLYKPKNADDIEADFVAIHGIGADPDWTWTYKPHDDGSADQKEAPVNWLKDLNMLPKAIPNVRIMRFGYDSMWYGSNPVKQRLANVANGLLSDLVRKRKKSPDRPIIFVGHCFGGLVMQKAYIMSKLNDTDYPGIASSTTGMIFMGTPHRGAGNALQSQGQIYQAIVAAGYTTDDTVLRTLEEGNGELVDSVRQFTRVSNFRPGPVKLFCFFEERLTTVGAIVKDDSIKEFAVNETSGTLDGHGVRGLPLDHFSLIKFKGPKDKNYKDVKNEIVDMVKEAKEVMKSRSSSQNTISPSIPAQRYNMPFSKLPFARDPKFATRNNVLQRIEEKFTRAVRVVLRGDAGTGKTHIAVEYAHTYGQSTPGAKVLWVNARTAGQFERSYKVITQELHIRNARFDVLKAVHRHLSQEANGNWLMILDGLDDEEALLRPELSQEGKAKGLSQPSLLTYIPSCLSGKVLITTRSMSVATNLVNQKMDYVMETTALSDEDAVVLLHGTTSNDEARKERAAELARELGRSPLGIYLASAYIQTQGKHFTVRNYLERIRASSASLGDKGNTGEQDEAETAIHRAWRLSFKSINEKNSEAARLMLLAGTFDLQSVRSFLLAKGTETMALFNEHISVLTSYGFVKQSEDGLEISVTPLIQDCVRRWLEQTKEPKWAEERALSLVATTFPSEESEEHDTCEILLLCAMQVLKFQPKTGTAKKCRASLLDKMAGYNKHLGNFEKALEYLQHCLTLHEEQADKDDGQVQAVKMAMEKVRDEQRREESAPEVVGSQAPLLWGRTLATMRSVAGFAPPSPSQNQQQEDVARARAELEECEKAHGKDHEETVRRADALAVSLDGHDVTGESIAMRKRVVAWCRDRYGPRSLDTVRQTYNLALAHDSRGEYDQAAELFQAALEGAETLLAEGSPELLRTFSSLAVVYMAQGKAEQAGEIFRMVLAGQQEKLGPDHLETLTTRQNAALAAQACGKLEMAGDDLVHVLRAQERLVGADHEATLRTACSLALNFRLRVRHKEAEALFAMALDGQQKLLGGGHPDTLTTRLMLGELLQEEGKLPEAREEYKAVLEGRKNLCGDAHPDTVYARQRLAAVS